MTRMSPGKFIGLKRIADEGGRFKMVAVDQRPPIEDLVAKGRDDTEHRFADVAAVKQALIESLGSHASALLLDPQYIFPTAVPHLARNTGLLLTLEDDSFEDTPEGRLSAPIPDWSVGKIQTSGGDAVKVLAWYRPDVSPRVREHQENFVEAVGQECLRLDIPFIFELLLYPFPSESRHTTDYVEDPHKRADDVVKSVENFAPPRFAIDVFKVESPLPASELNGAGPADNDSLEAAFANLGRAAGRPWVMLSAGADPASFRRMLELAYKAGASGYLAGRAIWWDACVAAFPDINVMTANLKGPAVSYMEDINQLTDEMALPWHRHEIFGEEGPLTPAAGADWRRSYPEPQE